MLAQLQWQSDDELRESRVIGEFDMDSMTAADFGRWLQDLQTKHPIPGGYTWLFCDESSEHFIRNSVPSNGSSE